MNVLIIDADSILWVAAMQPTIDEATHYMDEKVHYIVNFLYENEDFDANEIFMVVGEEGNFRKFISPIYKANRKEKPPLYSFVKAWALQNMNAVSSNVVEADDVIAAIAKREKALGKTVCVASIDKDLRQVANVWHFDMYHTRMTLTFTTEIEALRQHYTLMLMGDVSDNVKSIKGIGEKKAQKLLEGKTTEFGMRRITWANYRKAYKHKAREKYIIAKALITLRDDEHLIPTTF